jgi:hypothetical protein
MTTKTRAEQTVEMRRTRLQLAPTSKTPEVKQVATAGLDRLAKRRTALKKLHDFKDGVL